MVVNGVAMVQDSTEIDHELAKERIDFDKTKAGVKGLVDAGVTEIPRMFIQPPDPYKKAAPGQFQFPLIDFEGVDTDPARRKQIVEEVRNASGTWGFFEMINHGIDVSILDEMLNGVRRFNEQDVEAKKPWYTRDTSRKFIYNSQFNLYTAPKSNWRDCIHCHMAPHVPGPDDLPEVFRDVMVDYSQRIHALGKKLFQLYSEALGLEPNHLLDMDCANGVAVLCHYSPACPQPELTLASNKHSDNDFLTVLLQDTIGGLQVLHQNYWVDVPPRRGALIVNVGDLLQLVSNDKFISVDHIVRANRVGPRVSVGTFISNAFPPNERVYGPIKELLSEDEPPRYKETSVIDFINHCDTKGLDGKFNLAPFRI